MVTRGAAGATAILRNGSTIEVPALKIEPVDTTGAGDTLSVFSPPHSIWARPWKPLCARAGV